jgi:TonB family protein
MKRILLFNLLAALLLASSGFAGDTANPASNQMANPDKTAPALLYSVRPEPVEYSPGRLIEGYVTLEITVAVDGSVKSANVLYRTSAMAVDNAIQAVEEWKFSPATWHGRPVPAKVVYCLPFGANLPMYAAEDPPVQYDTTTLGDNQSRPEGVFSVR